MEGIQMKISNRSDLSADNVNEDSGIWLAYATTYLWIFANENPTVYFQFKDSLGNISNSNSISSVILPSKPLNILYQDVSNVETNEWREFIAWVK
jgi:hypothetical protein